MTSVQQAPGPGAEDTTMVHAVYGLFVVAPLVGIILAHIKRRDARGTWLESHYHWQIATFWWTALMAVIGFILTVVKIGWLLLAIAVLFFYYRVIVGWIALSRRAPPG